MFTKNRLLMGVVSISLFACSTLASPIKKQGTYLSPGNGCAAVVKTSPNGGFLQLYIGNTNQEKEKHIADDLTGFMWIDRKTLVYSSSPIYGKPGIYKVTCEGAMPIVKIIVGPSSKVPAYPDGSDYFEIQKIEGSTIFYYYGSDVDKINFKEFRTAKYLRSIQLVQ